MIEIAAVLACSLSVAALGAWVWRRVRGPTPKWSVAAARLLIVVAFALPLTGWAAHRVSKARTFQLFGRIVPRVETTEPAVALTFDDGPAPGHTDRILSILRDADVPATFFLNGHSIEEHPAEARKIVRAGHEIGNHTYSHAQLLGKSLSLVRREIERTDDLIRQTGYAGPIHFRSPYGKKLLVLPYYLWRTERTNVFWDVEPDSYRNVAASADRIVAHVADRAQPGSIILLHVMFPSRATSLEAVPGIISTLRSRGLRFVTVSELLAMGA